MPVTFDPATLGVGAALSPDKFTVSEASGAAETGAKSTVSHQTGKYYVELYPNMNGGSGNNGVGIINPTGNLNTIASANGANGSMVYLNGTIRTNGGVAGAIGGFIDEHTVGIAFDLGAKRIWFKRVDVGGDNWNATVGADPATGVGGLDISSVVTGTNDIYICGLIANALDIITSNFGGTPFVGTLPTGFTTFEPTPSAITLHVLQNARMLGFTQSFTGLSVGFVPGFGVSGEMVLASTEHADTLAAVLAPSNGMVMATTEAPDTFHVVPPARYNVGGLDTTGTVSDDDTIYVLENNETIYVPGDFSSEFVIPSEDTMYAT